MLQLEVVDFIYLTVCTFYNFYTTCLVTAPPRPKHTHTHKKQKRLISIKENQIASPAPSLKMPGEHGELHGFYKIMHHLSLQSKARPTIQKKTLLRLINTKSVSCWTAHLSLTGAPVVPAFYLFLHLTDLSHFWVPAFLSKRINKLTNAKTLPRPKRKNPVTSEFMWSKQSNEAGQVTYQGPVEVTNKISLLCDLSKLH